MKTGFVFPVLLLLTLAGCEPAPGPKKLAIVGAKLIDGKGGPPIEYSIILIEGSTIIMAGPQMSVRLPKGIETVDGMGKTIEPAGTAIEAGQPANLVMKSPTATRTMKEGQWLN